MAGPSRYSLLQIGLHWVVALLIVALWLIEAEAIHIPLGLALAALLAIRIAVRWVWGAPDPIPGTSRTMAWAAHWGHMALYGAMILATGLGVLYWLIDIRALKGAHELTSNALMIIALGHALAAIWHHYVLKDATLTRMTRRRT